MHNAHTTKPSENDHTQVATGEKKMQDTGGGKQTVQRAVDRERFSRVLGDGVPAWLRLDEGEKVVQRKVGGEGKEESKRVNDTGLPDRLKEGVEGLSGMSLDDVHVHYNSSRPTDVQALAYTKGTEIHVGPGQEQHLGHEAWHVVQQKQGRVKPTMQAKGVEINDDEGLEREADVMGNRAIGMDSPQELLNLEQRCNNEDDRYNSGTNETRNSTHSKNTSYSAMLLSSPLQCKVNTFAAETKEYYSPATDLIRELDPNNFIEDADTIKGNIHNRLQVKIENTIKVPTKIEANMELGGSPPKREGNETTTIGYIGMDEFSIKNGSTSEVFEGGHLIPHSLYGDDDETEGMDSYENLVPMSRNMNMKDWKKRENDLRAKLTEIAETNSSQEDESTNSLDVTIDITHQQYQKTLGELALLFHLTTNGEAPNKKVPLYGWLPVDITMTLKEVSSDSNASSYDTEYLSQIEENALHNTHKKIMKKSDFIKHLQAQSTWHNLSERWKNKLLNLTSSESDNDEEKPADVDDEEGNVLMASTSTPEESFLIHHRGEGSTSQRSFSNVQIESKDMKESQQRIQHQIGQNNLEDAIDASQSFNLNIPASIGEEEKNKVNQFPIVAQEQLEDESPNAETSFEWTTPHAQQEQNSEDESPNAEIPFVLTPPLAQQEQNNEVWIDKKSFKKQKKQ